jgi:hypothetical protein
MSSNLKALNTEEFRKSLIVFTKILDILTEFKNNYERRLNFTRLVDILNLPKSEINEIINLILNFQEKFEDVFSNYSLHKIRVNGEVYLHTKKKINRNVVAPLVITLTKSQLEKFNDIIYTFKHVKRGKGFDVEKNGSKILSNVAGLQNSHPYFFEEKENGLIYPSELGLELGELIISYNKSNRLLNDFTFNDYKIKVIPDG